MPKSKEPYVKTSPHRVAFYLPSVTKGKPTATEDHIREAVRNFLVTTFNGATEVSTFGFYFDSESGTVVPEAIKYYYSFCPNEGWEDHLDEVRRVANMVCIEFDQSEVSAEIDSVMHFYKPTKRYRERYEDLRAKESLDSAPKWSVFLKYISKKTRDSLG